jgi:hypothetical protein
MWPVVAWTPNNGEFQMFDQYDVKGRLLKYEDDRVEWQMIVESIAPDPQSAEIIELACWIVDDDEIRCVEGRISGLSQLDSVNWAAATMAIAPSVRDAIQKAKSAWKIPFEYFISVQEAAARLKVSEQEVYALFDGGILKGERNRSGILFVWILSLSNVRESDKGGLRFVP